LVADAVQRNPSPTAISLLTGKSRLFPDFGLFCGQNLQERLVLQWFLDQILKEIIRDFGARKRITDIKPTQDSDPSKGNGSFRLVQQPPLRGTAKD
jgi:hypothetical protein